MADMGIAGEIATEQRGVELVEMAMAMAMASVVALLWHTSRLMYHTRSHRRSKGTQGTMTPCKSIIGPSTSCS